MDGNYVGIPAPQENEYKEVAWGIEKEADKKHKPMWIPRGNTRDNDVKIEMLYCGICHSDCHLGYNDLHVSKYPIITGHELLGRVQEIGGKVTKFKVGEIVGVGCLVGSCKNCANCNKGDEQYCRNGRVETYNGPRRHDMVPGNKDALTYGGYCGSTVVHEDFVVRIPESIPTECAAPIMCAGITLYDPLRHWGACSGKKMTIGIVGVGGLGTMGIKLAKALGHDVIAISTSANKKALAEEKGASGFVVSKDPESIKAHAESCDLILNTVSVDHDLNVYVPLLAVDGVIV